MFPASARLACLLLLCGCVIPRQASAQYDVEPEDRVWLRTLLDVRLARGPAAPSWTDSGPGKTRYGGRSTDSGFERVTRVELAQLAIEAGAALPWDFRAQIQLNVQHDVADSYTPWLVEAILRREWGEPDSGWGLQAGVMNLPFSLEHTGAAWSPELTISASALNSWLSEDVSLAGIEGEWWRDTQGGLRLGVLAGVGYGPDLFGRLLALRGWAMGDAQVCKIHIENYELPRSTCMYFAISSDINLPGMRSHLAAAESAAPTHGPPPCRYPPSL